MSLIFSYKNVLKSQISSVHQKVARIQVCSPFQLLVEISRDLLGSQQLL